MGQHQNWAVQASRAARLPRGFQADIHTLRQILGAVPAARDAFIQSIEDTVVSRLRGTFEREADARDQKLTLTIQSNLSAIEMGVELFGQAGRAGSDDWQRSRCRRYATAARLGTISSGLPEPYAVDVPCVIGFPATRGLAIAAPMGSRERA